MGQPYTLAGVKVSISTAAQNEDMAGASPGFDSLTYTQISNVGNIGAYGLSTNMVSYPVMDRNLTLKAKGQTDGGNVTIQCAHSVGDAGQLACATAANPDSQDNYVFKVEFANGTIHYLRGPIGGPNHPNGGPEAFAVDEYTLGVNEIEEVDVSV